MAEKLLNTAGSGRFRWIVIAFMVAGIVMSAMLGWQLFDNTPAYWCAVAKAASDQATTACVTVLLELLHNKDHVNIGLLAIVGLTVLSLAVVALGVKIDASAPGGFKANIGEDKTTITASDGKSEVTIPTPPSGEHE